MNLQVSKNFVLRSVYEYPKRGPNWGYETYKSIKLVCTILIITYNPN